MKCTSELLGFRTVQGFFRKESQALAFRHTFEATGRRHAKHQQAGKHQQHNGGKQHSGTEDPGHEVDKQQQVQEDLLVGEYSEREAGPEAALAPPGRASVQRPLQGGDASGRGEEQAGSFAQDALLAVQFIQRPVQKIFR